MTRSVAPRKCLGNKWNRPIKYRNVRIHCASFHKLERTLRWRGEELEASNPSSPFLGTLRPPWKVNQIYAYAYEFHSRLVYSKSTLYCALCEYSMSQIILLSDGSVTRHLQLMTGIPARVECLEMKGLSRSESEPESSVVHPTAHALSGELVQRQVFLHLSERAYVYAASWWQADTVDKYLK